MNNPNVLSITELVNQLSLLKGAMPVTIEAMVKVKARKTDNPYDEIYKLSTVNGFTGFDYEASVNRQLVKEDKPQNFVADERKWGENLNNILVKKGEIYYIRIRPIKTTDPIYFAKVGEKLERVEKSQIEAFLPPKYTPKNQGTDKEIVYREYLLSSLRSITFNGAHYDILDK